MTYASEIKKGSQEANFLIKMSPRMKFVTESSDWTQVGSLTQTYYTDAFTLGRPSKIYLLKNGNSTQTEPFSVERASLEAFDDSQKAEWFWDDESGRLYVGGSYNSGVKDPTLAFDSIFIEYELYIASKSVGWHRRPRDTDSRQKQWRGVITKSPDYISSVNEIYYGFYPSFTTSFGINNSDGYYNEHIYNGRSLNQSPIEVWRWVGDLEPSNIQFVFRGFVSGFTDNDGELTLSLKDHTSIFDQEFYQINPYRSNAYTDYRTWDNSATSGDPAFDGTVRRAVIGGADWIQGFVTTNYNTDSPTTSDNRIWAFGKSVKADRGTVSRDIDISSQSALGVTNRVILSTENGLDKNSDGFEIGADILIFGVTGVTGDETYSTVESIVNDFEITIADSWEATGSEALIRIYISPVRKVKIVRDDNDVYTEHALRLENYLGVTVDQEAILVNFGDDLESRIGLPSNLNPNTDRVYIKYRDNDPDRSASFNFPPSDEIAGTGSPLGPADAVFWSETNPIQILYELLFSIGYVSDDDYNHDSWTTTAATVTEPIGIVTPPNHGETVGQTYREIIGKICASCMIKLFLNDAGEWEIAQIGPISSTTKTLRNTETVGFNYKVSYDELVTRVIYRYHKQDINTLNQLDSDYYKIENVSSQDAANLHKTEKSFSIDSYILLEADAETYAQRYAYLLGSPLGFVKLRAFLNNIDLGLGDNVKLSRENLLGDAVTKGTEQTRNMSIVSASYSKDEIDLELFDQLGVEDNSGDW